MEKEIQNLESAVLILARAIEIGRVEGVEREILEVLGYIKSSLTQ